MKPLRLFPVIAVLLLSCSVFQPRTPTAPPSLPATATRKPIPTSAPTSLPTVTLAPSATLHPSAAPSPAITLQVTSENQLQGIGGRSIGDPYTPELGNTGYDVQHYTLKLALDPAVKSVQAEADIEMLSRLQNLRQFSLDFAGLEVSSLKIDGQDAHYTRDGAKLVIDLPKPIPDGSGFQAAIQYSGQPLEVQSRYAPFIAHLGLIYMDDNTVFVAAEPDGAHYWFPCNDHPRDKATYRFELTVPEGMLGIANGSLIDQQKGIANAFANGHSGDRYTWEMQQPLASAFATVIVGNYQTVNSTSPAGVTLRSFTFPKDSAVFHQQDQDTGEMLDWMSSHFGSYPYPAFGYVTVFAPGFSLETQTIVLLSETMLNEDVRAHEMVHMWFGDWVSIDSWADIWRSEGAATYFSLAWVNRNNPANLSSAIAEYALAVKNNPSGYPLNDPPPAQMFGSDSYIKGALVFDALRTKMGDEAFFKGLQTYFQRYGGGAATQAQFQSTLEEAAGFSLDSLFQSWFK